MNIIFRVDSSALIGHGHVMRCITLANAISNTYSEQVGNNANLKISFICRAQPGHINKRVAEAGFTLLELAESQHDVDPADSSTWLATSVNQDAEECIDQLRLLPRVDLLIIDHYAIGYQWQNLLGQYTKKLLVIDDLADRIHHCDFLLDQTYNRNAVSYKGKVPAYCELLLGKNYILLRDEFTTLKAQAKLKRQTFIKELKNITTTTHNKSTLNLNVLISLGGSDPDNLSQTALYAIEELTQHSSNKITANVVISHQSNHLATLTCYCNQFDWVTLIIDSKNMSELMVTADIAIGACGGTAWERCALGLPCLTSINADNQRLIAENLSKSGAIESLGWHQYITTAHIISSIENILYNRETYQQMVDSCFKISDVHGAQRVANKVLTAVMQCIEQSINIKLSEVIIFKPAALNDCKLTFQWQSNQVVRQYFNNPKTPSWQEHKQWYYNCLSDPERELYILTNNENANVGLIRLDKAVNTGTVPSYEISIIITPEYQGKGLAVITLKNLVQLKRHAIYTATIHENNVASLQAFKKAGFIKCSPNIYKLIISDYKIEDNKSDNSINTSKYKGLE